MRAQEKSRQREGQLCLVVWQREEDPVVGPVSGVI